MQSHEIVTYSELAGLLGISYNAAKMRVARRKSWRRIKGNDGRVTIHMPSRDYHELVTKKPVTRDLEVQSNSDGTRDALKDISKQLGIMSGEVARLSKENGLLDASLGYEKKNSSKLSHNLRERDAELSKIRDKYQKLKDELNRMQNRSWWRRLFNVP